MKTSTMIDVPESLANRMSQYFAEHPEVSREEFLSAALANELEQRDSLDEQLSARPATREEIDQHLWLEERLASVRSERHGIWSRVFGL